MKIEIINTGKVTIIFLKIPVVICLCPSIVSFLSSEQWWNKSVIFSSVIPNTQLQSSSWSCGSPRATIVHTSSETEQVKQIRTVLDIKNSHLSEISIFYNLLSSRNLN